MVYYSLLEILLLSDNLLFRTLDSCGNPAVKSSHSVMWPFVQQKLTECLADDIIVPSEVSVRFLLSSTIRQSSKPGGIDQLPSTTIRFAVDVHT
jgi:hypothetical protein